MRKTIGFISLLAILAACNPTPQPNSLKKSAIPITGTWKLLTGTLIEKGVTTVTDYTKGQEFLKIINDSHFAFIMHDLNKGKDTTAVFSSGAGTYSLTDSAYTERLQFCSDRQWEGNEFHFVVTINNDTLIQRGVEKIEKLGVDRINIEKYVRVK